MTALETLREVIARDIVKMLLHDTVITREHNGISYRMVREELAAEAMSEFAQQEVSAAIVPIQQQITELLEANQGLREALEELQEVSKHYSLMQDIIKQALETYK